MTDAPQPRLIQVTAGRVTVIYEIYQDGDALIMRPVRWRMNDITRTQIT